MKIQSVLYYKYFFLQAIMVFFVSLILILSLNLIIFFTNNNRNILITITCCGLWLFPLYLLSISMFFLFKFLKYKKNINDNELYKMIKNSNIRNRILKKGLRLNIVFPKKDQEAIFFDAIAPEIEKQKKILSIKKGTYK